MPTRALVGGAATLAVAAVLLGFVQWRITADEVADVVQLLDLRKGTSVAEIGVGTGGLAVEWPHTWVHRAACWPPSSVASG